MTTLPVSVDDATAAAYRSAPLAERERLADLWTSLVRVSLSDQTQRAESFRRVSDATGREAQANGWNDDLDEALLCGDFDDAA